MAATCNENRDVDDYETSRLASFGMQIKSKFIGWVMLVSENGRYESSSFRLATHSTQSNGRGDICGCTMVAGASVGTTACSRAGPTEATLAEVLRLGVCCEW